MQINSVNNISYTAKYNKNQESKPGSRTKEYFEYLSMYDANKELRMSVGREEENGKLKAASALSAVGSIVSACTAVKALGDQFKAYVTNYNPIERAADFTVKESKKFARNGVIFKAAAVASVALAVASSLFKGVNNYRANKTANERGFMSDMDIIKTTKRDEVYKKTRETYNSHTKK